MPDTSLVEVLVRRVGDRDAIDWSDPALTATAASAVETADVEALRIIDAIQNFHYSGAAAEPVDRPINERWGRYFLKERLGEGSYGVVYRAWDPDVKRDVALKILHRDAGARLLEEAQRLGQLGIGNPNIVSVLGVEHFGGRSAICMEFVKGRTLASLVEREGPLREREAASIGATVCRALAKVHQAGLIHRDVKATNVMRADDGRIVLMDFGSGVRAGSDEARYGAGAPIYMAPEVLEGAPATARHDLYSVGVLLYFLVTGRHPVEGRTLEALRQAHQRREGRPLASVNSAFDHRFVELVDHATHADQHRRPHVAQVLAQDLDKVVVRVDRAVRRRLQARAGLITLGIVAFFPLLVGFLTSKNYHFLLGITGEFVTERVTDYWVMGRLSLFAPAAVAGMVTFALYLLLEVARLVARNVPAVQRRHARWRAALDRFLASRPLGLRDVASAFMIGTVVFLVLVPLVVFPHVAGSFRGASNLSEASVERLRLLGPPGYEAQNAFRQTFSFAIPIMCAVWLLIYRSARRRGATLGMAGWLGLAAVLMNAVFMSIPYRVYFQNKAPKGLLDDNTSCYLTAESTDSRLLFCPNSPPRIRSVAKDDPKFKRTGQVESIFTDIK